MIIFLHNNYRPRGKFLVKRKGRGESFISEPNKCYSPIVKSERVGKESFRPSEGHSVEYLTQIITP